MSRNVSMSAVLGDISSLLTDDHDNPTTEYDRALVELTGRLLGITLDTEYSRDLVLTMLRALS